MEAKFLSHKSHSELIVKMSSMGGFLEQFDDSKKSAKTSYRTIPFLASYILVVYHYHE